MKIRHEMFMNLFYKDQTIYRELFGSTTSFGLFESKIKKMSEKRATNFGYASGEEGKNKMKGDLFEIFIEAFIHLCGSHSTVCISSYQPVEITEDYGVDGTGLCLKSKMLTVQIKYRSDITYELVSDDLKQFPYQSVRKYGVDVHDDGNLVVITNCAGVNWKTLTKVLMGSARVINREDLYSILKSNNCFWDNFKILMEATFKEHLGDSFEYEWE